MCTASTQQKLPFLSLKVAFLRCGSSPGHSICGKLSAFYRLMVVQHTSHRQASHKLRAKMFSHLPSDFNWQIEFIKRNIILMNKRY